MGKFQTSLVQLVVEPLNSSKNLEKIIHYVYQEAKLGSKLIVFPELSNTGYVEPLIAGHKIGLNINDHQSYAERLWDESETINGEITQQLIEAARSCDVYIVVGLATKSESSPGQLFNSSLLIGPQGLLSCYHKLHLWQCEKLYFTPGSDILIHKTDLGVLGMQVCYDIRFPELTRAMSLMGAEVVTNIWASFSLKNKLPTDMGLFAHRAFTRAQENGVYLLSCNRAGEQGDCVFMGHSVICGPDGNVIAQSETINEDVVRAEIDIKEVNKYRSSVGVFTDRQPDIYKKYLYPTC